MSEFYIGNFEHVGFDYDGVLADSDGEHSIARRDTYYQIAVDLGDERYATISDAIHEEAHLHGSNPRTINAWILHEAGIIKELDPHCKQVDLIDERKRELYKERTKSGLNEIEGAAHFTRRLAVRRPGQMSIVSTAKKYEVMPYLERYKLYRLFGQRLILGDDPDISQSELKPHPRAYELAIKRSRVSEPWKFLAFEDSEQGITSAKHAGATVIALATTRSVECLRNIESDGPDVVVADYAELNEVIGL